MKFPGEEEEGEEAPARWSAIQTVALDLEERREK